MKNKELQELSLDELQSRLLENNKEIEDLRFLKALQQLENPLQLRALRKEIAQIKTVLREYELNIRVRET
jgi:large subunit ribosomal protein L29|tara:strand:- start:1070 stop:1279 length:210 start_codon:yes stop_codon:yes gene_type:complete